MGLQAVLQSAVASAFDACDDLVESVTYTRTTGGTYDVSTGLTTPTTTSVVLDGLVTAYSLAERQNSAIEPEDQRIILQGADLGFTPGITDEITRADSSVWRVVGVTLLGTSTATAAGWDLQLRRPH